MALQRIENGLEMIGLITPVKLVPRVTEAFMSLRDEGINAVTASQLRRKMDKLHPAKGWLPISKGNLPGALSQMSKRGMIRSEDVIYRSSSDIKTVTVYSMIDNSQKPQTTGL